MDVNDPLALLIGRVLFNKFNVTLTYCNYIIVFLMPHSLLLILFGVTSYADVPGQAFHSRASILGLNP